MARSEARSPPAGVLPIRGEMDGEDFYSVEQAADTLELTPGRVRQMLRAGDLEGIPPGERRGEAELGGRGWRVSRESVEALLRRRPPRPEPTETPETDARAELVEDLRDQVSFLRDQLDRERAAHSEARRIIGGLVQRIPEIEAPRESPESAAGETPTRTPEETGGGPENQSSQAEPRPWWRRVFGG